MQLHINAEYPEYFHSTSHRYQNIFRRFKRVSKRLKEKTIKKIEGLKKD